MKTTHHRAAKLRANSFNADENTVDIIWTTGAAVRRTDWDGTEYDEVLSLEPGAVRLDRLNAGAPFLNTHKDGELSDVIGKIVEGSARIENGRGLATVQLSSASCDADIVMKIGEGIVKNLSCGYWTHKIEKTDGDSGIATWTVVDWEPLEVSAVPIPADPGSQVRSANGRRTKPRMSKAERDYASGAAMATRLATESKQSSEQARGAAATRKLLASAGRFRNETVKSETFDKSELAKGARMARRLLRKS